MSKDLFVARLSRADRPFEEPEMRLLGEGEITIGRDPAADWRVDDTSATLSRAHCSLRVRNRRVFLRDHSRNGTFMADGARLPKDGTVELRPLDCVRLGAFTLMIDHANPTRPPCVSQGAPAAAPVLSPGPAEAPPSQSAPPGSIPAAPPSEPGQASLIEAFCQGARLDVSAFSSDEPAEIMRRIGAVYQETVLGLASLMAQRARTRAALRLDRTTIAAADNNPFKWAPSRTLAEALLRPGAAGFTSDAQAVRASFQDLTLHLDALAATADAAETALRVLAPEAIEAEAKAQGSLLRSRPSVCWAIHGRRYAALKMTADAAAVGLFADPAPGAKEALTH